MSSPGAAGRMALGYLTQRQPPIADNMTAAHKQCDKSHCSSERSRMHEAQILKQAYGLLQEYGITRGAFARTENGTMCGAVSPGANSFCSVGAITRAARDLGRSTPEACDAIELLRLSFNAQSGTHDAKVTRLHDAASDEEVLNAFQTVLYMIDPEPHTDVEMKEMVVA